MIIRKVDLQATTHLKGIAILLIMLHNYYHILDNAPGENEFTFSISHILNLLHHLATTPLDAVKQLFSFFGHYAVQVFIFLSGYGLAVKCSNTSYLKYKLFIWQRLKKLYPALFFAIVFLFSYKALVTVLFPAKGMDLAIFAWQAFLKLTLLSNFLPGEGFSISGPWWFFSLIFQLYLIAPLLLRIRNSKILFIIAAACLLLQLLVLTSAPAYMEYFRLNLLGHLPEFCLGIYFARKREVKISKGMLLLLVIMFAAGAFNAEIWLLSGILVPVFFLVTYNQITIPDTSITAKLLNFFGNNSLYFFAVHGLCRAPFVPLGNRSVVWSWVAALLYLLVVTALTMAFKYIVRNLVALRLSIPKAVGQD
ncbi:acyltransferase family protein [Pontibacter vulgaris]|uniref:acyltransferase family protein n=1 Tax=Pontibacter vulgaris TaxID=2905679 RepID=UPI001FA7B0C3|nr:acyltransferase [Pontibacter vulgaris]